MTDNTIISDIQGRENINTLLAHFEDGSTLFFPLQYTESRDKRAYYQVADWELLIHLSKHYKTTLTF